MIIKQYIKDFEKLGFGMFVHYGLYSVLSKGEWAQKCLSIPMEEYSGLAKKFNPDLDWAKQLVATAKTAGCKYITLTTRHHDGFSLYDTCGLNEWDAPHVCGRDLVKEFVDACRSEGIVPFFYHTLLDWYEPTFESNFSSYLEYLRKSVKLLCTKYGKIGGIWFDGTWSKPGESWEEDALYGMIREHQPDAMIINNTGLSALGELGHIELDSVTFERGKPKPLNLEGARKYVASEMCQVFNSHWGYAHSDFNYKAPAELIRDLTVCRGCGSNFLLNVGPMANGTIAPLDAAILEMIGRWVNMNSEALYEPRPSGILVENKPEDFILVNGSTYYLFCDKLPILSDPNVELIRSAVYEDNFILNKKIKTVTWLDNGENLAFEQVNDRVKVHTIPYRYGTHLVVRVAKIETE